jgi:hypothetical protein
MPITNWGLLEKSQADDEKIEEAVNRIVAVHEADEESHLGVGESLQSHKAAEIIDHLAGSIIADKLAIGSVEAAKRSFTEVVFSDPLTTLDGYTVTGNIISIGVGIRLDGTPYNVWNEAEVDGCVFFDETAIFKSLMFQISAYHQAIHNFSAEIGIGDVDEGGDGAGLGFKIHGGHLYGFWHNYIDIYSEVDLGVCERQTLYVLRAQIIADGGTILFYVNGVYLGYLITQAYPGSTEFGPYFSIKKTINEAGYEPYLYLCNMVISRSF